MCAERPNQVWLADITYVPTGEEWLYVAVVLDLPPGSAMRRFETSRPSQLLSI